MSKQSALLDAIDRDAYEWLSQHGSHYIDAIESELQRGMSPEQIRSVVARNVGPDRLGLALRCEQAARYLERMQR